eukprot:850164-Pleurochrysis_carterae.AAC.4
MFWRSGRCATVNHVQAMATCVAASALQELHQGYDKASTACELAELNFWPKRYCVQGCCLRKKRRAEGNSLKCNEKCQGLSPSVYKKAAPPEKEDVVCELQDRPCVTDSTCGKVEASQRDPAAYVARLSEFLEPFPLRLRGDADVRRDGAPPRRAAPGTRAPSKKRVRAPLMHARIWAAYCCKDASALCMAAASLPEPAGVEATGGSQTEIEMNVSPTQLDDAQQGHQDEPRYVPNGPHVPERCALRVPLQGTTHAIATKSSFGRGASSHLGQCRDTRWS